MHGHVRCTIRAHIHILYVRTIFPGQSVWTKRIEFANLPRFSLFHWHVASYVLPEATAAAKFARRRSCAIPHSKTTRISAVELRQSTGVPLDLLVFEN